VIRFLYNLLFPFALLFFLPGYLAKMRRRGNYREKFGQRLGFYDDEVRARLETRANVWMHAVSVGEVAVALKLAHRLKELDPGFFAALTTTTTTGFAFAGKEAPDWMEVLYAPLDFWPVMRRAFALIRPRKIILVEAEVWPNFVALAHARGISIALVNARLSPRSERRFRRFRFFVAPLFRRLDLVCIQEPSDRVRWTALGVRQACIRHTGNIKFDTGETKIDDQTPRQILAGLGIAAERPILFGGSTHRGEEAILAELFLQLRADFPDLFLILAPRHVERTREIREALERFSLHVALRSKPADIPPDCLILDTTGELRNWYAVATVVFVGKSLSAQGGQNPVEPILAGKPVIFGPHLENFAAIARLLIENGGALQVHDAVSLGQNLAALLRDPSARQNLVTQATAALSAHRGATAATADLIMQLKSHADCPS
jgi:3-deoxy-D-manno-octulosonic-acid transferase